MALVADGRGGCDGNCRKVPKFERFQTLLADAVRAIFLKEDTQLAGAARQSAKCLQPCNDRLVVQLWIRLRWIQQSTLHPHLCRRPP